MTKTHVQEVIDSVVDENFDNITDYKDSDDSFKGNIRTVLDGTCAHKFRYEEEPTITDWFYQQFGLSLDDPILMEA